MTKRIVAAAAAFVAIGLAPKAAWAFGAAYDAPTLSMGGTYVSRYDDINSPFFNPADLRHVRGYFYLGPELGMLLATDAGTYQDILGATQTPATGEFASLMTYVSNAKKYSSQVTTAFANGTDPGPPPTVGTITLPSYLDAFVKVDSGLFGLDVPFGDGMAAGWRAYMRTDVTPFIQAPQAASIVQSVLQGDHDMATGLLQLRSDAENGNISALGTDVSNLKGLLSTTLAPFATGNGVSFTLGAETDAYLANAFSYEMPLPVFRRPLGGMQSGDTTLGFTVKLFTGGGAFGLNQIMQQYVDNALPSTQIPVGIPGRYELTTNINLAKPLNDINAALDNFESNPASGTADLTAAAGELPQGFSLDLTSHTAGSMGAGLDIGTIFPLQDGFRVGAILQNFPQAFWPGQKTTYQGTVTSSAASGSASASSPLGNLGFSFAQAGKTAFENYTYSEPTALRIGGSWEGPLGFSAAAEVGEAFDNPNNTMWVDTPTLNLGVQESIFNILYLRAGGQVGGLNSLVGGGVGLNIGIARLDLGAALAPGLNDVNTALSLDVGM